MKTVLRNPLFYLSIALVGIIVFQFAQFVQGQTGTWQPPTAPPPGGQPEAPLDTGTSPQTKKGNLNIVGELSASGKLKIGEEPDDKITIEAGTGRIVFDRAPRSNGPKAAITLRQDPPRSGNWVLQATHNDRAPDGGWFTLGAGTGGAGGGGGRSENLWTEGSGSDIYRLAGDVGIGTNSPATKLHLAATTRKEIGLTLEYPNENFPSGGKVYFRDGGTNANRWTMGVFPSSYRGVETSGRTTPLGNAWYLEQFGNRYGDESSTNFRLIVPDTGAIAIITPEFSTAPTMGFSSRGGLAIQNEHRFADGLGLFNKADNAIGAIWLDGNRLNLGVNNTVQTFSIDTDGKRSCPTYQSSGAPLGANWEFVKAGDGAGYCIQKNKWADDNFTEAANICLNIGGRLCSYNEWRYACQKRDTIGATFGDVSWEWVDEITGNDQALRATRRGSACHSDSNAGDYRGVDDLGTSRGYRCCIDR